MRLTVGSKVCVGMAIVLAFGAVAMLIIYQGLVRVNRAMQQLADIKEPIYTATHEMEINVNEISMRVLRYLAAPSKNLRNHVAGDERDFERFHAQYLRLAETEGEKQLGRKVGELYNEFKSLGRDLMDRRDHQDVILAAVITRFEQIDEIIDQELQARLDPDDPDMRVNLDVLNAVEADLAEVGMALAHYQRTRAAEHRQLIESNERELRETLARLHQTSFSEEDAGQVATVEAAFNETIGLVKQVVAEVDLMNDKTKRLVELRSRKDGLFDEEMQVLAREHLNRPHREAEQATTLVLRRIGWLLALFVTAAVATAVVLVRNINAPLRKLTEGTQAVSQGDLAFRIMPSSRDEFADLADQFNQMVARLEATTVSKGILEQNEKKLREVVDRLEQEVLDRQRAEAERSNLEASLRRAEIMSVMGALVVGVAHQVRNPLFGVSSLLDAMEARFDAQPEFQRYLAMFREQVERLNKLMQDLLEYGKPSGAEKSLGSISDALTDAVKACTPLAERLGAQIEMRLEGDLGEMEMDRSALAQAFENLLDNALQQSPPSASVTVEARPIEQDGQAWIECQIKDAGSGFTPADLPHLFEPFFSRRPGGTGLGLAIAKRFVEAHDGEITPGNLPQGGAAVIVRLPCH